MPRKADPSRRKTKKYTRKRTKDFYGKNTPKGLRIKLAQIAKQKNK